jgi:hypothetical protein
MLVQSIERFVAMGISLQSKRRHQRRIDQQTFTPSTENLTCQRIFQHIGLITTYSTLCTQLQHMTPENNKDNIELLQSSMAIVDSNQRPKNLPVKLHMRRPENPIHFLLTVGIRSSVTYQKLDGARLEYIHNKQATTDEIRDLSCSCTNHIRRTTKFSSDRIRSASRQVVD